MSEIFVDVSVRLGYSFYMQRNFAFARKEFLNALNHANYLKGKTNQQLEYLIQEQIDNVGLTYFNEGQLDSAQLYFDSAVSYINNKVAQVYKHNPMAVNIAMAVAKGNIARIYLANKQYQEAKNLLRQQMAIKQQDKRYLPDAIADFFWITSSSVYQNSPLAQSQIDSLNNLIKLGATNPLNVEFLKIKAIHFADKNPSQSKKYLTNYLTAVDSMYRLNSQKNFKIIADSRELTTRENKMILKEQELVFNKKLQNFYLVIIVFAALLFVVLVLALINYRSSLNKMKKLNQQINFQKEKIDNALKKLTIVNRQLKTENLQKTGILGIVAHDLKSPLDAIITTTRLILEIPELSAKEKAELLELVKISSDNALSIIHDLVIYARLEYDEKHFLDLKESSIKTLIEQSLVILKQKANEKNITLNTQLNGEGNGVFDESKLSRVIMNLVGNAIKFSHPSSTVNINLHENQTNVVLEITDTGIGIDNSQLPLLFEAFSDLRKPGTSGERSTGLGLFIVKKTIDSHKGTIEVKSVLNKGTTFIINLPKKPN